MGAHLHLTDVRLTRDPEEVETSVGKVVRFGVAWNDKYTDSKGVLKDEVNYMNCSCRGPKGNVILAYLKKGDLTSLHGRIKYRAWVDTKTGANRHEHSCTVFDVDLLPKGMNDRQGQNRAQAQPTTAQQQQTAAPRATATTRVPANAFEGGSEFPPEEATRSEDDIPF